MKIIKYHLMLIILGISAITHGLTSQDNDILVKLQDLKNLSINLNQLKKMPGKVIILHNDTARLLNLLIDNLKIRIKSKDPIDKISEMMDKTLSELNPKIEELQNERNKLNNNLLAARVLRAILIDQIIEFVKLYMDKSETEINPIINKLETMKWVEILS